MPRQTAVVALLLAAVVGCGGSDGDGDGPASSVPSAPTSALPALADDAQVLRCDEAIDALVTPPAELAVVMDAVALPTGNALVAYPASASSGSTTPDGLFAKFGLVVRAETTTDLAVSADVAQRASIGWGDGQSATAVRVPACPPSGADDEQRDWLVFAGGYQVSEPMCLPIEVRSATGATTVSVGVGAACPGQAQPPASRP